ncbi:MAG: diphosphomevalonate decarboxylase [Candidatus Gottesmanbacteria bacterium]
MMKATALAPANIALIKYWGKRSDALRTPLNDSISMNLSGALTTTTIEFSPLFEGDDITFVGETLLEKEHERIIKHLNRIRKIARKKLYARVVTKNSFPKGAGIASSASGFAALTVAAVCALGLQRTEKELTILSRIGSGSACRSIPDGFSWWHAGKKSSQSYAESIFPASWWNIRDVLCVVSKEAKKISSTEGMDGIKTSPYWKTRMRGIPGKIDRALHALKERNMELLGNLLEEDAISMHCVMMTQKPPLFYWNESTLRVIEAVYALRKNGIAAYYTMDAGPNVHVICKGEDEDEVSRQMKQVYGVQSVIINKPALGTHSISNHLF